MVSVVNICSVGNESLISESESSVSEFPDGPRGVGILEWGCGRRNSNSWSKSWPLRIFRSEIPNNSTEGINLVQKV